jgi:hypothetical protein
LWSIRRPARPLTLFIGEAAANTSKMPHWAPNDIDHTLDPVSAIHEGVAARPRLQMQ